MHNAIKKSVRILLYTLSGLLLILLGIRYLYYVPDAPVEKLNQKYHVTPANYMALSGMNVHYRIEGLSSDSVPLVLLHGTGSSLYAWDGWTNLLKDKHQIIRMDLPGFGLTGPHPTGDYTLKIYIEFIHSFLKKLGVKRCVLAGNSIGGEIAWRYALNYPGQVKKLILVDAAGYPTKVEYVPYSYVLLRLPVVRDIIVKATPRSAIRNSLEYLYGDPDKVTDDLVELYFDMTRREGNRQALTERMESIARPAPVEKLSTITIPTLIVWGGKDQLIPPEYAHRFHRDLPNSTLAMFPEAGHQPMEEIPRKTATAAAQFLEKTNTELLKAR